jgi:rRNA-processing protein FCF1
VPGVEVVRAAGSGDDEIVARTARYGGQRVTVVTADRGLVERVTALGAGTTGPRRLLDLLGG